jgi:protein-tyrosine phosphatase
MPVGPESAGALRKKLHHGRSFFPSDDDVSVSRWFQSYGFADVFDNLTVGAYPLDEGDVATLAHADVQRVLNLTEDVEYRPGDRRAVVEALAAAGIEERRLPLTDYGGLPPEALEAAVEQVSAWLDEGARTYVHCRAGWQRSAAVVAAVVAVRAGIELDEALDYVQRRKPTADPLEHQRADLRRWWVARTDGLGPDANRPGEPA